MGKRTKHAPGTFSWVDVATPDTAAAKEFYSGLFGWEYEDVPDAPYSMARLGGDYVAAISGPPPGQEDVPPHWNNYVTVEDADAAAAKAAELGGSVVAPVFDVFEAGRMAVIQDPTGAVLSVWQPKDNIGAERVNEPGSLSWNELHTPDVDKAGEFYSGLFGWGLEAMDTGGGPPYVLIQAEGAAEGRNGGITAVQDGEPPNWMPYFVAESSDDAAAKVSELGGQVHMPPFDLPAGRIAIVADPQGAVFGLFEGDVDD